MRWRRGSFRRKAFVEFLSLATCGERAGPYAERDRADRSDQQTLAAARS
jgi:hypothetical protein